VAEGKKGLTGPLKNAQGKGSSEAGKTSLEKTRERTIPGKRLRVHGVLHLRTEPAEEQCATGSEFLPGESSRQKEKPAGNERQVGLVLSSSFCADGSRKQKRGFGSKKGHRREGRRVELTEARQGD